MNSDKGKETFSGRERKLVHFALFVFIIIILTGPHEQVASFSPNPEQGVETIDYYGKEIEVFNLYGQEYIFETGRNKVTDLGIYHAPGVIVDRSSIPNKVYVVDSGNNRILGFDGVDQMDATKPADIVFGQPNMELASCNGDNNLGFNKNPTASSLCLTGYPLTNNTAEFWMRVNIDVDQDGNLYVPDYWNNRVLKFNQPFSEDLSGGKGDTVADFVWGQNDMNSNGRNRGTNIGKDVSGPDDHSLWISTGVQYFDHVSSRGVSVDLEGNVWVADTFNSRVLRFPPDSKQADLVLGQPDFTSNGCVFNGPLNTMCTPTLARLHPTTGELFVLDEYPAPFLARMLVFSPPFSNGMSAYKVIIPNQDGPFTNWDGWDGTGEYRFQSTGFVFNTYKEGDYSQGEIWINEHSANRTLLIDFEGNIIDVVGGQDIYTRGGDAAFPPACGSIDDGNYVWHPGGSIGLDDDNNIYLADEIFHTVYRYALPYTLIPVDDVACLPEASGIIFPKGPNTRSRDSLGESVGLAVYGDQLIVRDEGMRMKVWSRYRESEFGVAPDFVISKGLPGRNRISGSVDDTNRLWMVGEHHKIKLYQLPILSDNQNPLAESLDLYWSDTHERIEASYSTVAFDHYTRAIYAVDLEGSRIFRVSNYNEYTDQLLVDMVIGQRTKEGILCNQGLDTPNAETLCKVTQIKFDTFGNLFVVDNDYECQGNDRIVMYSAEDMQSATELFPNLQASSVFIASSFNERGGCGYGTVDQPGSPVSIAFNSRNAMVVGNDGYYGDLTQRELRQIWVYSDPLDKQTPDAFIEIYMGTPGELAFDSYDNLLIQDHTWYKVMLINFDVDPEWVSYLPDAVEVPLSGPSLLYPSNTTTIYDQNPEFDWSEFSGAEWYLIQVDDHRDFSSPAVHAEIQDSDYLPTESLEYGSYYWRVRVRDALGDWGNWSPVWMVTIAPAHYEGYLPVVLKGYSPPEKLLHVHFEGSFNGEEGEIGSASGVTFVPGYVGEGVLLDDNDSLSYETMDNIHKERGSIMFWLRPTWDGDDNESYVFFEVGDTWFNRMRIMKDGANYLRFMVWSNDTEYGVSYNVSDWTANDWHCIRVEWEGDKIDLYIDDELQGVETEIELPSSLASIMYIGSTSSSDQQAQAFIDEFVIYSRP